MKLKRYGSDSEPMDADVIRYHADSLYRLGHGYWVALFGDQETIYREENS